MAVNGEIELTWGDGDHKFNIAKVRCLLELEEKCNAGFGEIYQRLMQNRWYVNDVRETLRLGLIGGGMEASKALALVNRYCDDKPLAESIQPALAIVMAALVGIPGDNPEKKVKPERAKEGRSSATVDSSVPLSMDSEPPSDLPRAS